MIAMVYAPSAGNALGVLIAPPEGALAWRVLRSAAGVTPASVTDPAGTLVFESASEAGFIDVGPLQNGQTYTYTPFYQFAAGGPWQPASGQSGTPSTQIQTGMLDTLTLVRDRIALGIQAYIAGGALQPASGSIPVLIASPQIASVTFPLVTCHLVGDDSAERFVGDEVGAPRFDGAMWHTDGGYLSGVSVMVIGWAQTVDERSQLRDALKSIVQQNLPILAQSGLSRIDQRWSDQDDMESFSAPVYQAVGTLSCLAPSVIERVDAPVSDVVITNIYAGA